MADDITKILETLNPAPAPNPDPNPNPNPTPDPALNNAAFAKMRIELKAAQERADALEKEKQALLAKTTPQPEVKTEQPLSPLEQRLKTLEEAEQRRTQVQSEQRVISEIDGLKKAFPELKPEDLIAFAEDASKRGVDLRTTPRNYVDIYREMHFNEILNKEIEKALADANIKRAPGAGPRGTGNSNSNPQVKTIQDIIAEVAKKL